MTTRSYGLYMNETENYRNIFGFLALFSGTALIAHILLRFSLRLTLVVAAGLILIVVRWGWKHSGPSRRAEIIRFLKVGVLGGALATVLYDISKFGLSRLNGSPYNPFEVIRIFGVLLVGSSAPRAIIVPAGTAYHLMNGILFAVAFCFLFGRRGAIAGVLWGLFLETIQLTLYPGWLDIRFYREFAQISAFSHVVYGVALGLFCKHQLEKHDRGRTEV